MDYTTLNTQILDYANRNDPAFVRQIPNLIDQAMSKIYSEVKCIGFQKIVAGNMIAGTATIQKPQDFKENINFQYTLPGTSPFSTFLLERTYEFCVTYAPNPLLRGKPMFFSTDLIVPPNNVAPAQLYIAPTPDAAYAYELTYLSFPPLFNAQNPRNYLTDRYPDLLIYACMMQAIPFLKSDERVQTFEALYEKAKQAANTDTRGRYTDRITDRGKA